MAKGFVLQEMKPDKFHNRRNIFVFNESEELRKVLDTFNKEEIFNDYIKNSTGKN